MKNKKLRPYVIGAALLCLLIAVYALFIREPSVSTPTVTLPTPRPVETHMPSLDFTFVEVTPDTVQEVVRTLKRSGNYSRAVSIESFWSGGSSTDSLFTWVSDGNTLIRRDAGAGVQNILLTDKGALFVWYDGDEGVYSGSYGNFTGNDADKWLRSITYEELLELPAGDIYEAGYVEYGGEACIYAKWKSGVFDYENTAYISVNHGLLTGCETYDGEELIYRMVTGSMSSAAIDPATFTPPQD